MIKDRQKIALVTGASSGIGQALVEGLVTRGYQVIGLARSPEKLEALQAQLPRDQFSYYTCDVADQKRIREISEKLKQEGTYPTYFYLNAGMTGLEAMEPTDSLDTRKHESLFDVNYHGVLYLVSEWLSTCAQQGGATFVVTNSVNATFAPPGGSAYSASKAAISKAFDGLRLTHAQSNLKFVTVFCGPVHTPGRVGNLPFTWTPEKMAQYIIKRAEQGKRRSHPSLFYFVMAQLLHHLPIAATMKVLGLLQPREEA